MLYTQSPQALEQERSALLSVVQEVRATIIVSNETARHVPMYLSRRFSEEAGVLHQDLARICDRAFVAAGLLCRQGR
jgi:adenosylcobinamide kinase/adenosylcobinamide-phosphate guanylyltransferase